MLNHEYVRYGTRLSSFSGGREIWLETEEEARDFAAGSRGNGSGEITKKTVRSEWTNEPKIYTKIDTEILEELDPVTKFTEEGQKRRDKYLADKVCVHKNRTDWIMQGAGCHKDYERRCVDCGKAVEFQ